MVCSWLGFNPVAAGAPLLRLLIPFLSFLSSPPACYLLVAFYSIDQNERQTGRRANRTVLERLRRCVLCCPDGFDPGLAEWGFVHCNRYIIVPRMERIKSRSFWCCSCPRACLCSRNEIMSGSERLFSPDFKADFYGPLLANTASVVSPIDVRYSPFAISEHKYKHKDRREFPR